jgi:hypothetical protein
MAGGILPQHRFLGAARQTFPDCLAVEPALPVFLGFVAGVEKCVSFDYVWRAARQTSPRMTSLKNDLLFLLICVYFGIKMTNAHRQFFGFTYRYWRSIAALADGPVHI